MRGRAREIIDSMRNHAAGAGAALADQAAASASNFIFAIMLARWMPLKSFGAYSVGFSLVLLAGSFHYAMLIEPMTVFGARYRRNFRNYFDAAFRLHIILTGVIGVVLAAASGTALAMNCSRVMTGAIFGAGLAQAPMLLLWLERRALYILHKPSIAAGASVLCGALSLGGIWLWHRSGRLDPLTAFVTLGAASMAACAAVCLTVAELRPKAHSSFSRTREVLREHWKYARWMVAAGVLGFIALRAQILLAAGMDSIAAAGALHAMITITVPASQMITAFCAFFLPLLAARFAAGDVEGLRRRGLTLAAFLITLSCAYEAVLLGWFKPIEQLVYGAKFAEFAHLIPVLGLVPVCAAIANGCSLMLRASRRAQVHLVTAAVSAPVGAISAVILVHSFGTTGLAVSMVASAAAGAAATVSVYARWRSSECPGSNGEARVLRPAPGALE